MIVRELVRDESDPRYETLEAANTLRQFGFLVSLIETAITLKQVWLSQKVIKSLNYHAIACLHDYAGEYRPCFVELGDDPEAHKPPPPFAIQAQVDQFVNQVNANWGDTDPFTLSAFVLWRLNHIHPFINGNGRTARAAAYYVLCLKMGGSLPGNKTLPELICENRSDYMSALKTADQSCKSGPAVNLGPLAELLRQLLVKQQATTLVSDDVTP